MGRGIELDDVDGPRAIGGEIQTAAAFAAGIRGRALLAVQGAGEDARRRRLAAAARAGEQIGVMDAVVLECTRERNGDVLLADDLVQPSRTVGAIQGHGHAGSLCVGPDDGWPARTCRDPPRTRQSPLTLAAFRPWGGSAG